MSASAEIASLGPKQIWEGVTGRTVHGERLTLVAARGAAAGRWP